MKRGETLLLVAAAVVVLALIALFAIGAKIHVDLVASMYALDSRGGLLVEQLSEQDRVLTFWRGYEPFLDTQLVLTPIALLGLGAILLGLRRMDRDRSLGLVFAVWPLVAIAALGLSAGLMSHLDLEDQMVWLHRVVSAEPMSYGGDHLCTVWLEACSRILAFDSVRTLALGASALLVLALIPAARAAWRAGAKGHRLGRGWSGAAILCCVLGVVALVATRGHRRAHEQSSASCDAQPERGQSSRLATVNVPEVQAVQVADCDPERQWELMSAVGDGADFVGQYVLLADGTLVARPEGEPMSVDSLREQAGRDAYRTWEQLDEQVVRGQVIAEARGERQYAPIIMVYVDARSSGAALHTLLRRLSEWNDVHDVILIGEDHIERELATIGAWQRHVECAIGRVHVEEVDFRDTRPLRVRADGRPLTDFDSAAEFAAQVHAAGLDGLTVATD